MVVAAATGDATAAVALIIIKRKVFERTDVLSWMNKWSAYHFRTLPVCLSANLVTFDL